MALSFTEIAARQVLQHLELRQKGLGIRLLVQTSECSGMNYQIEVVDQATAHDLAYESHGARIFVDAKSLVYVDGSVVDFSTEGNESGFVIHNPNVISRCGCGESFQV